MSAFGTSRTSCDVGHQSAIGGLTDVMQTSSNGEPSYKLKILSRNSVSSSRSCTEVSANVTANFLGRLSEPSYKGPSHAVTATKTCFARDNVN
jgi:hypothetical protein